MTKRKSIQKQTNDMIKEMQKWFDDRAIVLNLTSKKRKKRKQRHQFMEVTFSLIEEIKKRELDDSLSKLSFLSNQLLKEEIYHEDDICQ